LWRRSPLKPARKGGAVRLYKWLFRHRILRFLLLQRRTTRSSLFETEAFAVEKPRSGLGSLCSKRCRLSVLMSAQPPEDSPVLFACSDLDMISFGESEDDMLDSMSLAASDTEELSGSVNDPAPLSSADTSGPRTGTGMDAELFRVRTRAVDELGLEWSPPEKPSCSLLDEWPLANGPPHSFQRSKRNSPSHRAPPTQRTCVLRLPPPSRL
ncbi:hypothetical protein M9458_002037, partial [Cirrhinus mrigala]